MAFNVARCAIVLLMSMTALVAHAVTYEITTTADGPVTEDGECTIREAVQAISEREAVGDCPAGSGGDTIILEPGTTYVLDQGEMVVGGVNNTNGQEQAATVRMRVPDSENDDPAILDMAQSGRAFYIHEKASVVLDGVALINGVADPDGGGNPTGDGGLVESLGVFSISNGGWLGGGTALNGGLIHATGSVLLNEGTVLRNGEATTGDGGAIYLHGSAGTIITQSRLETNSAQANGGAIFMAADHDGNLTIANSLIDQNVSATGDGGAFYLQGTRLFLNMVNSSLLGNEAASGSGTIHIDAVTDQTVTLNNVTIADSLSGGMRGTVHIAAADDQDAIYNTVIVGDRGNGNCSGAVASGSGSSIVLEYSLLGPGCLATGLGTENGLGMDILVGLDGTGEKGVCGAATTAGAACSPLDLDPWPAYMPALTVADSPWANGRPQQDVDGACATQDQRGISRLNNTCDVGAIEFEVAVGEDDENTIVQGRIVTVSIVDNDLGDGVLDCRRVTPANAFMPPFLYPDYQSNEPGDTDVDNDGVDDSVTPAGFDVDECAQVIRPPSRDGADVRFVEDPDQPGNLLLEYSPGQVYHGVDQVAYRINRAAFEPTRDMNVFATRGNRNVEGVVFLISEPASGLNESEKVDQLGSAGGLSLVLLSLLGLVRRFRRVGGAVLLLLAAAQASAVEIEVTTLDDNFTPGDGFCSVREALYSSIDELVNIETACTNGQGGEDTILLPRGCIQLDPANGPLLVEDRVVIRGEGAHGLDAGNLPAESDYYDAVAPGTTTCRTDDSWTEGTIIVGDGDAIIDATSQLELRSLSLFRGQSGGSGGAVRTGSRLEADQVEFYNNTAANLGGAIFLAGSTEGEQRATIENSYFLNNTAQVSGGAISLSGASDYDVEIGFSTFEGNRAEDTGGAMLVNPGQGDVAFANVNVFNNTAGLGSGGLDLSQAVGEVLILNSTLVQNTGGTTGALDTGANSAGRSVSTNSSIHALNYVWNAAPGSPGDPATLDGACSSSGTPEAFNKSYDNLFSNAVNLATECPAGDRVNDDQASAADDSDVEGQFETDGGGNLFTAPNYFTDPDVYVPPNLAVTETAPLIVDRGTDDDLANGYGDLDQCRATDIRGFPRSSGQQCDRGAYEVQVTTAQDDEVDNDESDSANVVIDVLANDSTDPVEGQEILEHTVTPLDGGGTPIYSPIPMTDPTVPHAVVTPPAGSGASIGIWLVKKDDTDQLCEAGDECVLLYNPEDPTPLAPDSGDEVQMNCIPEDPPYEHSFDYEYDASNPGGGTEDSTVGTVTVTLNNLPPRIADRTILNEPGGTLVIRLDITDPFNGEVTDTELLGTMELEEEPLFAAENQSGVALGTGIKLNTPAPGYVTYVAGDTTKRFRDSFRVSVEDSCGARSTGGEITIVYEQEDVSGGDLLSAGASMVPLGLLLLVGGFRRRRLSR